MCSKRVSCSVRNPRPSWPILPRARLSLNGLREIFDMVKTPGQAVYDGRFEVRPSHIVRFGRKGLSKRAYWSLQAAPRAAPPEDGELVLDFNKAHNPPSAVTPYANCPIAPPENALAVRVTVGEKRYRGHRAA